VKRRLDDSDADTDAGDEGEDDDSPVCARTSDCEAMEGCDQEMVTCREPRGYQRFPRLLGSPLQRRFLGARRGATAPYITLPRRAPRGDRTAYHAASARAEGRPHKSCDARRGDRAGAAVTEAYTKAAAEAALALVLSDCRADAGKKRP